jgi:hypothetical protein
LSVRVKAWSSSLNGIPESASVPSFAASLWGGISRFSTGFDQTRRSLRFFVAGMEDAEQIRPSRNQIRRLPASRLRSESEGERGECRFHSRQSTGLRPLISDLCPLPPDLPPSLCELRRDKLTSDQTGLCQKSTHDPIGSAHLTGDASKCPSGRGRGFARVLYRHRTAILNWCFRAQTKTSIHRARCAEPQGQSPQPRN